MMKGLLALTLLRMRLFAREPSALFFTLMFPSLLLFFFGTMFRGAVDTMVPGFAAMVIGNVGLVGIPVATTVMREHKILRRYRATIEPTSYMCADLVAYLTVTFVGAIVLVSTGMLLYGVEFRGNLPVTTGGFCIASLSFFSAGYLIASLARTVRVAQSVGQLAFFPMLFLSGGTIPLFMLPEWLQLVSAFLPMRYVVLLLERSWTGEPAVTLLTPVAVLLGQLAVSAAVSVRYFRWE